MPNAPEHAFEEKSTKLLIRLPLRPIYNRTFQCETPCSYFLYAFYDYLQCASSKPLGVTLCEAVEF